MAALPTRSYPAAVFQQNITNNQTHYVSDLIQQEYEHFSATDDYFTWTTNDYAYQLRRIEPLNNGASYKCIFVKFRLSDFPELGKLNGDITQLDIEDNDGVVEKNHFLYIRQKELLIYQGSREGSSVNTLASFFAEMANKTEVILFNPVLKHDAAARLMSGDIDVKKIEFSIARPSLQNIADSDTLGKFAHDLCNETNGYNVHVMVSRQPHSPGEWLSQQVKQGLTAFSDSGATVARAWVEDDSHPIDLITDRIKGRITVSMDGYYPVQDSVYTALNNFRIEHQDEINQSALDIQHLAN